MKIRPLIDRVLVEPTLVATTNQQGMVVVLIFTVVMTIDPHGNPHGLLRVDAVGGESTLFKPVEVLVARSDDGGVRELLILISPHIGKQPAEQAMARMSRDLADTNLLHWIITDAAGNELSFSVAGVVETLPPRIGARRGN